MCQYHRLLWLLGTKPCWNNQLRGKTVKQPGLATNVSSLALGRMIQSENMNNPGAEKQLPCSLDKGAKAPPPPGPDHGAVLWLSALWYDLILFVHHCLITQKQGANFRGLCGIHKVYCINPQHLFVVLFPPSFTSDSACTIFTKSAQGFVSQM